MSGKCTRLTSILLSVFVTTIGPWSVAAEPGAAASPSRFSYVPASGDPGKFATAAFMLFQSVERAELRNAGGGVQFVRENLKLDHSAAVSYVTYLRGAIAELRAVENEQRQSVCVRRSSLLAPVDFAKALEDVDRIIEQRKAQLARGSSRVLSQSDQLLVELFISRRIQDGMYSVQDHSEAPSPEQVLNFMCDRLPPLQELRK